MSENTGLNILPLLVAPAHSGMNQHNLGVWVAMDSLQQLFFMELMHFAITKFSLFISQEVIWLPVLLTDATDNSYCN